MMEEEGWHNMEEANREELLKKIMEYKFYINDLTLYLDTHNQDQKALQMHNEYVEKLKEITKIFEKQYGPLTVETVMKSWEWARNLWPWQRGFNR